MNNAIISDTSCLIALDRINRLDILQSLFSRILTTPEVQAEFGKILPDWIHVQSVKDLTLQKRFEQLVDIGEASALTLVKEYENAILIIDEKKGRRIARENNIRIIGTLQILLIAKQKKIISGVKPIILELSKHQFRFSKQLIEVLLKEAGEITE